jgi:polar amino acid transport system substrate-binding protein
MALRTRRLGLLIFVLAIGALVVAGCGSSKKSSSSTQSTPSTTASTTATAGADAAVAKLVPASVKSGTWVVAADASYAPNEFIATNGKTVIGMDADLAAALAQKMGIKEKIVNQTFDSIIPGIQSGKYGMGASSFTDTKEREKVVDFVTYFNAGTSFYVKASGGADVASLADLCDKTVAVEKGTTQQDDATAQGKKCKVKVSVFPDQNGVNLALSSGRADVAMADSPVAAYQVKQSNGQFKLSGQPYGVAPYGLALPKGNGMTKPVLAALKALMASGQYKAILTKWGVQAGAIDNPTINGATS